MSGKYSVVVGGTFDVFHKGHELLIEKSLTLGNSIIGITSDELAQKSRDRDVADFEERKKRVVEHAQEVSKKENKDFKIVEINDPIGPAIENEGIEYIVVSPESKTVDRANEINEKRYDRGYDPLKIEVVEPFYAEDGHRISSTRIRNGEITRKGNLINREDEVFILSDIHYGHSEKTKEEIEQIVVETLENADGRRVFVLGDIIHETGNVDEDMKNLEKMVNIIKENTKNNCYFLPGNHDIITLDLEQFTDIVGHDIPYRIQSEEASIYLLDSSSQAGYDNLGYLSEESLELLEEINTEENIIMSHFPLVYTNKYRDVSYFEKYPEAVFPINKIEYEKSIKPENIITNVYGHLHARNKVTYYADDTRNIIVPPITIMPTEEENAGVTINYEILEI